MQRLFIRRTTPILTILLLLVFGPACQKDADTADAEATPETDGGGTMAETQDAEGWMVLFDGTVWQDDEMIRTGVGAKTGRRMGHMPISGDAGSLKSLRALDIGRRVYIHNNNTNPILIADSPERAAVEAAGWEIAHDGLEITL